MTWREHSRQGRQFELSAISRELKRLTLNAEQPRMVIVASQMSREGTKGRNWDSANYFRDTGSLEQDANVAFVLSPVLDPTGEEDQTLRKVSIVASRHSRKDNFLVKFVGERSLVAGSEIQMVDINKKLKEMDEAAKKSKSSSKGSLSRYRRQTLLHDIEAPW